MTQLKVNYKKKKPFCSRQSIAIGGVTLLNKQNQKHEL